MSREKKNVVISGILIAVAIIFTVLVMVVDVKPVGVNGTDIGFSTINSFIFESIGVHMFWYNITDILGYISIFSVFVYAVIGFMQLIRRKSIAKVDKELIALGVYYAVVIVLYLFFEKFVINYRPTLVDGVLEASYPSSHTLMTVCLCGGSILINKMLFRKKITKYTNKILLVVGIATIIGRLISGVHWFTDILGGIFISSALLMTFYSVLYILKKNRK